MDEDVKVPSLEETVERLVDWLGNSLLPNLNVQEEVKRAGIAILLADHWRRHVRDGKHPLTGEPR